MPKNNTPGTLHLNDVVQISEAGELITSWKRKLKVADKREWNGPVHLGKTTHNKPSFSMRDKLTVGFRWGFVSRELSFPAGLQLSPWDESTRPP